MGCIYGIMKGKGKHHFIYMFSPCLYICFTQDVKSNDSSSHLQSIIVLCIHERINDIIVS
jgi:hypothetical protein